MRNALVFLLVMCASARVLAQDGAATALEEAAVSLEAAAVSYADVEAAPGDVRDAMEEAERAFQRAQVALGKDEELRSHIPVFTRKGSSPLAPGTLQQAAAASPPCNSAPLRCAIASSKRPLSRA